MNKIFAAALLCVGLTSATSAQLGAPGPEHARLDAFAGRWTIDGESERSTRSANRASGSLDAFT